MSTQQETYEIQVKVPICVTLNIPKDDAESMYREELCELVDSVLEEIGDACHLFTHIRAVTVSGRELKATYKAAPHWDHLPVDECELTCTMEGLFPEQDEYDGEADE